MGKTYGRCNAMSQSNNSTFTTRGSVGFHKRRLKHFRRQYIKRNTNVDEDWYYYNKAPELPENIRVCV